MKTITARRPFDFRDAGNRRRWSRELRRIEAAIADKIATCFGTTGEGRAQELRSLLAGTHSCQQR